LAELIGNYGEYLANIAKVKQAITESEFQILNLKTQSNNDVIKELQEIQTKIADLEERARATKDVLRRTIITAPQDGIVNGLKYHTQGGVISPGGEIMDLIPQDDELIVEIKVNPQDIDVVLKGLPARVILSAYRAKVVPPLEGKVINVSADSFTDQQNGASYFLARIRINKDELKQLEKVRLYPGMPTEAYIITGSRTFFQYLFDPITVSMRRALREE
jgi:HlyD family secretion protein/epimerase transport system membrane fusion protein